MGIEDKLVDNWVGDEQQTLGQRFVEKFPSQAKDDPELKMKQERNVQWLIDTLVPQSGSDVVVTAGSMLAGGPFGRLFGQAAKPALSKYYASILGSGKIKKSELKEYLKNMVTGGTKKNPRGIGVDSPNWKAIGELEKQSPSMQKFDFRDELYRAGSERAGSWGSMVTGEFDEMVEGIIKEAKDAYKYYYGK